MFLYSPQIGFGLDGFAIYGRYLDTTAPGYSGMFLVFEKNEWKALKK